MAEAFATPTFDEEKLKADLLQFIDETKFVMLVTKGKDGFPMARIMGFLHDDFNIWFTTVGSSLKIRQMTEDNKVTLLWKEPTEQHFKFLTMKGTIEIFNDEETVGMVRERYAAKYTLLSTASERVVMKFTPVYARAEGFGIRPPAVIRTF